MYLKYDLRYLIVQIILLVDVKSFTYNISCNRFIEKIKLIENEISTFRNGEYKAILHVFFI